MTLLKAKLSSDAEQNVKLVVEQLKNNHQKELLKLRDEMKTLHKEESKKIQIDLLKEKEEALKGAQRDFESESARLHAAFEQEKRSLLTQFENTSSLASSQIES